MGRWKQVSLAQDERAELGAKIKGGMEAAGVDAVIVAGSGNITYLTGGVVFPYLDQKVIQPVALYQAYGNGEAILFTTFELSDIPDQLGWTGDVHIYELDEATPAASLAKAVAGRLGNEAVAGRTIGYDFEQMSGGFYKALAERLPGHNGVRIDKVLRQLKLVKSDAEVRLLEITGRMGDRGFISALNHAEGAALDTLSYPIWEYGERFRVHVGEFGGSGVGNLSILQGERARELYSKTGTRETFLENEYIRMEYSLQSYGYWVTGARTVYVGQPDLAATTAWANNCRLKQVAVETLTAGTRASQVYQAVQGASADLGIEFWQTTDIGHGVGTTEREAPYLALYDDTVLAPGMVIVVAVYTYGPRRELLVNKDLYLVTDGQPRLLTWYKNFDALYALHGTSARHG